MSIYSTMKDSLQATGLYNTEQNIPLYAELAAYSDAFEICSEYIDELKREAFIKTAQDYGISNIERLYGRVMSDLTNDERRAIILNRLSITPADFTVENIKKILASCGLTHYRIYENKTDEIFTVTGNGHKYTSVQIAFILSQLSKLLPAHLEYKIYLNEISWKNAESKKLTWLQMEEYDYTWKQIDELREDN